jgi:type II secretory pathway component GspD/PulD (secretin)
MLSARRAGIFLALTLVLFPGLASAQDDTAMDLKIDSATPIDADKLLKLWSDKLQVPIVVDPQMAGTKVRLDSDPHFTWGATKAILDFYDVVVEERDIFGARIFFAHLRRNLPAKVAPPFPVVSPEELASHKGQIVTTIIPVKNGSGNDLFATVRGLLFRDVNRIANILYVRGPDTIIIVDLAENVDYYVSVIRSLDQPERGTRTRVFHLEHASCEDAIHVLEPLFVGEDLINNTVVSQRTAKIVADPRTNQLLVRGSDAELATAATLIGKLDVASDAPPPRWNVRDAATSSVWKLAAGLAFVAFLGQTLVLRRIRAGR